MNKEFLRPLGLAAAIAITAGGVGGSTGTVYADGHEVGVNASTVDELGGVDQSADLNVQATSTGFVQIAEDMDLGDGTLATGFNWNADAGATGGAAGNVPGATGGTDNTSDLPAVRNDGVIRSGVTNPNLTASNGANVGTSIGGTGTNNSANVGPSGGAAGSTGSGTTGSGSLQPNPGVIGSNGGGLVADRGDGFVIDNQMATDNRDSAGLDSGMATDREVAFDIDNQMATNGQDGTGLDSGMATTGGQLGRNEVGGGAQATATGTSAPTTAAPAALPAAGDLASAMGLLPLAGAGAMAAGLFLRRRSR